MSEVTIKNFEEIINQYESILFGKNGLYSSRSEALEFMKFVKEQFLMEFAKKAIAGMDFNFTGNVPKH